MLTTLNIVIGLVFVLLLFSLLASTVMEVVAAVLSLRAKHLRYTLENMLGEKMDDFVRHPLFRQLSFATDHRRARLSLYYLPGHVNKNTFVTILQDILESGDKAALQARIAEMEEGEPKRMLQFILRHSGGDPALFKAQAERWFDDVMDRASDWYKRNMKWWLFGVGLVLAALFNADTIRIYHTISSSATVQNLLVDMATDYVSKTDTVTGPNLNLSLEQAVGRMDSALQTIEHIRSPLGLGWDNAEGGQGLPWWLVKIAGLLLTGIAVTFGAPFWFDLLRKMLSLRSGGGVEKAPEPQTQTQTPPPLPPPAPRPVVSEALAAPAPVTSAAPPAPKAKPAKPAPTRPAPKPTPPPPPPPPARKPPVG